MYTKEENKVIMLTEEGGVAAYPYEEPIDEIFKYCENYINNNKPNGNAEFNYKGEIIFVNYYRIVVPQKLVDDIGYYKEKRIIVAITEFLNENLNKNIDIYTSEGLFSREIGLNNNIVNKIAIKAFAHRGKIIPSSFYKAMYHELNHNRDGGMPSSNDGNDNYGVIVNMRKSDDKTENAFGSLVYRLLIPTEFRAFVAGLYGDLKHFDKKNSFRAILPKTMSYQEYVHLKDVYIPLLERQPKEVWVKLMPYYNLGNLNPGAYKNKFLMLVRNKLGELFKRWGKVGALYMEERVVEGITTVFNDTDIFLSLLERMEIK